MTYDPPTTATKPNEPAKKPAVPTAFKWDAAKVEAKIKQVYDFYKPFDGRPGFNPWFYILRTVKPLEARIKAGEQTEAVFNEVMALECKEPLV